MKMILMSLKNRKQANPKRKKKVMKLNAKKSKVNKVTLSRRKKPKYVISHSKMASKSLRLISSAMNTLRKDLWLQPMKILSCA